MKEIKTTKHKVIRHIKNLFEHEKDYCKPARLCCLWDNKTLNMKLMLVEIKDYQLKNTILDLGQI